MPTLKTIKDLFSESNNNVPQAVVFGIIAASAISFISLVRKIYIKSTEARKKKTSDLIDNTPIDLPEDQEVEIPMIFTTAFLYSNSGPHYRARMRYMAQQAVLAEQLKSKIEQLELKKKELCLNINNKNLVIQEAEARANKKKNIEQITLIFEKQKKNQDLIDRRRLINTLFYGSVPPLTFLDKKPVAIKSVAIETIKLLFPERYITTNKFQG